MVFVVKSQYDEYELPLKTWNDRVLLETVEKHLEMHKPPLRPKSVNNMPITLRHDDRTLAVDIHDGQRLELEAEILPGNTIHTLVACGNVLSTSYLIQWNIFSCAAICETVKASHHALQGFSLSLLTLALLLHLARA